MRVRFDPGAPYEVEETDVPFARPEGKELLARIYRPKGEADAPLAALVDVHGGAWSRGERTTGAHHGRALAASGLLVISLDFRQGSEHKHPAASADVAAGTCAPTRPGSASIPDASGSWAARAVASSPCSPG